MDVYGFIILLHIIGTILGTGGATIAEVQINKALKDNKVTPEEGALLHGTYSTIRVGMAIIIVSIFAMVWYHIANGTPERLLAEKVWFKEILFVIIIINAISISNRWVPLWLGAATSFTAWWMATILGVAGYLPYPLWLFGLVFVVATLVMAGVLHYIRKRMTTIR